MPTNRWSISDHARGRLADRAVAPSELVRLLARPQRTLPNADGTRTYVGYGITAVVDEARTMVITVGVDGASQEDWEEIVVTSAARAATPVEDLVQEEASPPARRGGGRRPRASAVVHSHVLDGASAQLHATVARYAAAAGGYGKVRVVRPGLVEIDLT